MTAVLPPRTVRKTDREWNPLRDGGPCSGTTYNWVPDLFDENSEVPVPSAIVQLCDRCPLREKCLSWAMVNNEYGFWAGTSRYQRLQLGRDVHRVKCPGCSSTSVVAIDRSEICTSCGISWTI